MFENIDRKIVLFIMDNPGLTKEQLSTKLNINNIIILSYLNQLINDGQLTVKNSRYYAVSWEDMIDWDKILQEKQSLHLRDK